MREKLIGDNVFWFTLGIIGVMLVATLGIILNILIRDGPDVPRELDFLEGLVGAGVAIMTLRGAWESYLVHRRKIEGKDG